MKRLASAIVLAGLLQTGCHNCCEPEAPAYYCQPCTPVYAPGCGPNCAPAVAAPGTAPCASCTQTPTYAQPAPTYAQPAPTYTQPAGTYAPQSSPTSVPPPANTRPSLPPR
jgi:hypothetical protein